jgi:hypothetical protein
MRQTWQAGPQRRLDFGTSALLPSTLRVLPRKLKIMQRILGLACWGLIVDEILREEGGQGGFPDNSLVGKLQASKHAVPRVASHNREKLPC